MKATVTAKQIGTALRERREARGIKVRAMAARAAIPLEALMAVESGVGSATVAHAQLVAFALGTTLVDVVHDLSQPPAPTPGLSVEAIAQEIVRLSEGRLSKVSTSRRRRNGSAGRRRLASRSTRRTGPSR